jgi:hypothetical protein
LGMEGERRGECGDRDSDEKRARRGGKYRRRYGEERGVSGSPYMYSEREKVTGVKTVALGTGERVSERM